MELLFTAIADPWISVFALSLTRVASFVMTFPLFRSTSIPRFVKVAWAFALTVAALSQSSTITTVSFGTSPWLPFALSVTREAFVGGVLGFGFGLWLTPAKIAGAYVAQEMGLSIATLTNPSSGESTNVVSELFLSLSVIVFFISDAHLIVIRALLRSFDRFGVGGGVAFEKLIAVAKGVSDSQMMGMEMAAPIGGILLLVTIGLSTMMKAIPQFNLFTFGTAIRVFSGLLTLFVCLPEMIMMMDRVFRNMHNMASRFGL